MKNAAAIVIDFLSCTGCPHTREARTALGEVVGRMAPGALVREIEVRSDEQARELRFPGSPSIRVNGADIEGRTEEPRGLTCRSYEGLGVPPTWMIEAALMRALEPRHILFLCVGNQSRSQLAEGLARSLAPAGVVISSAGSSPSFVSPHAIRALDEIGIDASRQWSKGLDEIDVGSVEAVVTLCQEEYCPSSFFPRVVLTAHWTLADPGFVGGDDWAHHEAFRATRDELLRRLRLVFGRGLPG